MAIRIITILILLLSATCSFAVSRASSAELDELQRLLDARDYDAAEAEFQTLFKAYPKDGRLRTNYGVVKMAQNDIESAVEAFRYAIKIEPDYIVGYNNLAYILIMVGEYEEAFDNIEIAVTADPYDESYLANLTNCIVGLRDSARGITIYERLIEQAPDNPRLYNDLGTLYMATGDFDSAEPYLQKAVDIAPKFVKFTADLARDKMYLGDTAAAEAMLTPLLESDGEKTDIWDALITLYISSGDADSALKFAKEAVEQEPNEINYNNLATVYYVTGIYNLAIEAASKGIEINETAFGHNLFGHSLYLAGYSLDKAEKALRRAIELDPYDPLIRKNLGDILLNAGYPSDAISSYQKAIEYDPLYYDAYDGVGYCYLADGEYEKAREVFQKVVDDLSASDPVALNGLGAAYAYLQNNNKAIEYLNLAIRFKPDYVDAYNTLGFIYTAMGEYAEALTNLELAARYSGGDAIVLNNLAVTAYLAGDYEKANMAYDAILMTPMDTDDAEIVAFRADALVGRGLTSAMLGNFEAAQTDIYNANSTVNDDGYFSAIAEFTLALIADNEGNENKRNAHLRKVIEIAEAKDDGEDQAMLREILKQAHIILGE